MKNNVVRKTAPTGRKEVIKNMREAIEKRLSVVRNLLSDSQGYYVQAHKSDR